MQQHEKKKDILRYFILACKKEFHFLEKDFTFKYCDSIVGNSNVTVTYKSDKAAVAISLDERYGGIAVDLIRLKDSQIPELPIQIDENTKLNEFDFEDLLRIRNQETKIEKPGLDDLVFNPGRENVIERVLKQYATALRSYAMDFLTGDFSIFNDLEKIVRERVKQFRRNKGQRPI